MTPASTPSATPAAAGAGGDLPAFPCTVKRNTSGDPLATPRSVDMPGMSLRDWFAGQALPYVIDAYTVGNGPCLGTEHMPRNCALHAYRIADAMLAARAQVIS